MVQVLKDNIDPLFKGQLKEMFAKLQPDYLWKHVVRAFCSYEDRGQYQVKMEEFEKFSYKSSDDGVQGYTLRFGNLLTQLEELSPANDSVSVFSKLKRYQNGLFTYNKDLAEQVQFEGCSTYQEASRTATTLQAIFTSNGKLSATGKTSINNIHGSRQAKI